MKSYILALALLSASPFVLANDDADKNPLEASFKAYVEALPKTAVTVDLSKLHEHSPTATDFEKLLKYVRSKGLGVDITK